jgi:hypothetical protein
MKIKGFALLADKMINGNNIYTIAFYTTIKQKKDALRQLKNRKIVGKDVILLKNLKIVPCEIIIKDK